MSLPQRYATPAARPAVPGQRPAGYAPAGGRLPVAGLQGQRPAGMRPTAQPQGMRPMAQPPAPLFLAQGTADEVISPRLQDDYVARLCDAGRPLRYTRYADETHMSVLEPSSALDADLEQWTQDRLAGLPQEDSCP